MPRLPPTSPFGEQHEFVDSDQQRWPEPGEAVNLIVSGAGERLAGMLRQQDQRDAAAVLAIAGPILLAAAAVRTMASPFLFMPAVPALVAPQRMLATAVAFAAWWTLVALARMLRCRPGRRSACSC